MNKEKMSIELLESVQLEINRFNDRIKSVRKRFHEEECNKYPRNNTKETAALRRSALDLKNELTRITQSRTY